jgi:hypothetical protein
MTGGNSEVKKSMRLNQYLKASLPEVYGLVAMGNVVNSAALFTFLTTENHPHRAAWSEDELVMMSHLVAYEITLLVNILNPKEASQRAALEKATEKEVRRKILKDMDETWEAHKAAVMKWNKILDHLNARLFALKKTL